MTDFLLELRSEEIPARMQDGARDSLARLFAAELAKAGLSAGEIVTYATPRRLALIARDLPAETAPVSEEVKGPRANAPAQALDGFLRKTGLAREALVERDGVLFAVTERPGRATAAVLAEAIPAIVRAFPWPKAMRWGAASTSTESLRWVRPLHGIVALFGEEIVPVEIAGIQSGAATLGHRFHHPGAITIGSAQDYVEKLRACHVIVDQDERCAIIRDRARQAATSANLALVEDEGLVTENAGLTEWPLPLLGRFDPAFLDVPPEVIQLTARVNQKYFVCRDGDGKLANAFICTANIEAADGGARIVEGNRKVLAARLSDARFFYETDLKVPLDEQAKKLDRIVFHEKLGTVADKVERVAKLARWLVEEGVVSANLPLPLAGEGRGEGASDPQSPPPGSHDRPSPNPLPQAGEGSLATLAERAARLCKADLVTGMVGEFPELQGVIGGYYARAQGEDPRVADAIRDHYKPVGQGDDVPTDPVTVAVSLADKLDTLVGFFALGQSPTGSRDPYALRRAALGIIELISTNDLKVSLNNAIRRAFANLLPVFARGFMEWKTDPDRSEMYEAQGLGVAEARFVGSTIPILFYDLERIERPDDGGAAAYALAQTIPAPVHQRAALLDFLADRLKVQQREAGVRHDLIDAVFALGGEDDLVRLLARVRALQAFIGTEDGANLLTGYKRAANILKKEGYSPSPSPLRGEGDEAKPMPGEGQSEAPLADTAPLPSPLPGGEREQKSLFYTPEPDEASLHTALDAAEPAAADAVAREDFEGAMAALATLRAAVDAFFDTVTVNDPDAAKRAARLALLARVRDAVHTVADFSKIEG